MLVTCNHCGNRVLPKSDETCPSCGGVIDPEAMPTPPPAPTQPEPHTTGKFLNFLERKSKAGMLLGVGLTVMGAFGGSYQRRGTGATMEGSNLMWAGVVLIGIFFVLYLVTRRRKD